MGAASTCRLEENKSNASTPENDSVARRAKC